VINAWPFIRAFPKRLNARWSLPRATDGCSSSAYVVFRPSDKKARTNVDPAASHNIQNVGRLTGVASLLCIAGDVPCYVRLTKQT
jgi:hypothetical protein